MRPKNSFNSYFLKNIGIRLILGWLDLDKFYAMQKSPSVSSALYPNNVNLKVFIYNFELIHRTIFSINK